MSETLDLIYFLVEGKGYKQQFSKELEARRTFGKRKKVGFESNEPFYVKLFGKKDLKDDWILLDEIEIKAGYYETL